MVSPCNWALELDSSQRSIRVATASVCERSLSRSDPVNCTLKLWLKIMCTAVVGSAVLPVADLYRNSPGSCLRQEVSTVSRACPLHPAHGPLTSFGRTTFACKRACWLRTILFPVPRPDLLCRCGVSCPRAPYTSKGDHLSYRTSCLKDSQNYTGKTGAAKGCMCLSAVMIVSSTDQCLDQYTDQFPVNRSRDKRQQRSVALNPPQPQVSACGTGSSGLFWWLCVRSPRRTTHGLKRRAGYGTT